MNKISRRAKSVQPFRVMEFMVAAHAVEAAGRDVVHMEVGEPDFGTPEQIVAAARVALTKGQTQYTQAKGLPELRRAIARYYADEFGVVVDEARVVVTPGASGALQLVFATLLDMGDSLAVTDPGYPANANIARTLGVELCPLPVSAERGFWPTVEQVIEADAQALLLNSPANPTGTVLPISQCQHLADACRGSGKSFILDEIYQGLVYDQESYTALEFSDDIWVINSFSKYFGMTGWRLGWLVAPADCVEAVERLAQNLFIASSTLAQYAALAALRPTTQESLIRRRDALRSRRDYLIPALNDLGFTVLGDPQGAFYLYADASQHTDDAEVLVRELLEAEAVVATPGFDFGQNGTRACVRFAYTTGLDRLELGIERMRRFLKAGA